MQVTALVCFCLRSSEPMCFILFCFTANGHLFANELCLRLQSSPAFHQIVISLCFYDVYNSHKGNVPHLLWPTLRERTDQCWDSIDRSSFNNLHFGFFPNSPIYFSIYVCVAVFLTSRVDQFHFFYCAEQFMHNVDVPACSFFSDLTSRTQEKGKKCMKKL